MLYRLHWVRSGIAHKKWPGNNCLKLSEDSNYQCSQYNTAIYFLQTNTLRMTSIEGSN